MGLGMGEAWVPLFSVSLFIAFQSVAIGWLHSFREMLCGPSVACAFMAQSLEQVCRSQVEWQVPVSELCWSLKTSALLVSFFDSELVMLFLHSHVTALQVAGFCVNGRTEALSCPEFHGEVQTYFLKVVNVTSVSVNEKCRLSACSCNV